MDQLFKIFGGDVDEGFHLRQGQFQILGGDCLAVDWRVVSRDHGDRLAGPLGISNARQVVIGQGAEQHGRCGQHHRTQGFPVHGNGRRVRQDH
ncbi:hypothetical protein D3C81_1759660 [compost metagenome]